MEFVVLGLLLASGWFLGSFIGLYYSIGLCVLGAIIIYSIWDDFIGTFIGILIGIILAATLVGGYFNDDEAKTYIKSSFEDNKTRVERKYIEPVKKAEPVEEKESFYDLAKEWLNSKPFEPEQSKD